MTVTLRPYQEFFVHEVRLKYRSGAQSVLLVAATGSGKTVVFSYIAKSAAALGRRVLILAHRDTLIKQASAKLMDYGVEHGIIMAGFTPDRHQLVQVASVQTLVRRLKKGLQHKFDLVVIDEAHLSAARTYREILEAFPTAKVLGVTGSPCRLDGKGLGREAGGLFDELVMGISIRELIEQAFLVKPVVYAPAEQINLAAVKKVAGDYDQQSLAEVMDKPKITGSAIAQYQKICPGVPAVAWCVNVQHAEHVAGEFNAAGIPALTLSGESTADDRERALRSLSNGKIKVITFAMLLVEGVDCPAIGAVIMLRPTMSLASYLQVIGRGLRPIYAQGFDLNALGGRQSAIAAGPKGNRCFVLDHAGLTFKHGFADEVREWSLDGAPKKKGKKKKDEPTIDLRQCPKCFLVTAPEPVCPGCGHVFKLAKGPEHVDGELAEITPEMEAALSRKKQQIAAQASAKSVDDMVEKLGYSRVRAEKIVAAREEKNALRNGLRADLIDWQRETGLAPVRVIGMYLADVNQLKPRALRELRTAFERYRDAYRGARARGEDPEFAIELSKILNPAAQPQSERLL